MSYKEKYSAEEWETLSLAPYWLFHAIASADNKIDKKEQQSVNFLIANSGLFTCELFREVLVEAKNYDTLRSRSASDNRDYKTGLTETGRVLDFRTEPDIAADFKHALIAMGVFIGMSSGRMFDFNFSPEEEEALTDLGKYLNMNVHGVLKTTVVRDILGKLPR